MKYLVLVSHGQFADGLKDALSMLAGERDDVLSAGLKNGKSADEFAEEFSHVIEGIHQDDEIILLGDLIGGSNRWNEFTTCFNNSIDERYNGT